MTWWVKALIAWAVLSFPIGIFIGRFISAGKGKP